MSKKRKIIFIGIGIIVLGTGLFNFSQKNKTKIRSFHEAKVVKSDFTETVLSTGTVAPENRLEIKPPVAGRMETLLVTEGQKVKRGQVLAWVSSTERAAMLDSARAEGSDSLKQWETYYKPTPIYAPIDGIIILQNIWAGQSFATTDAILTMSDRLTVKAQVDETDISKVKLDQDAEITLDAYPGEAIAAKVVHVAFDSKTVNSVTTYIVDVLPKEVPKTMLSGMTANVTFILKNLPGAILIPNEAIATENNESCVHVKIENGDKNHPPCQKVVLGSSSHGQTIVEQGLNEGQMILIPDLKPITSSQDSNKGLFSAPSFNNRKSTGHP